MRLHLVAVVILLVMAGCSGDGGDDRASAPGERQEPATSQPAAPVTAGRYDAPTGAVPTDLAGIRAEIEASLGERDLLNIGEGQGPGAGLMYVYLRLGREHIADQLIARYGEVLRVAVGDMPWPLIEEQRTFEDACQPLPAGDDVEGLSATLSPAQQEVELGDEVDGTVVLTNGTAEPVRFFWGGAGVPAFLVQPGTDEPVGVFIGAQTMQMEVTETPAGGESEPVRLVVGVVSCTPQVHTAVPPGRYELVAVLHLEDGRAVRSAPAEVVITNS